MIAAFLCIVASVHDGDTLTCADRTKIRIAGIEANELRGGCHLDACARMPGPDAKAFATRLLIGRTLRCWRVGMSYRRVVADCTLSGRNVGCTLIASGAAVDWVAYRVRYRMEGCDGRR